MNEPYFIERDVRKCECCGKGNTSVWDVIGPGTVATANFHGSRYVFTLDRFGPEDAARKADDLGCG